jgi:hypothetical protein
MAAHCRGKPMIDPGWQVLRRKTAVSGDDPRFGLTSQREKRIFLASVISTGVLNPRRG